MSKLREARDFMGFSRERVAAEIGVSSKTIERWERGEGSPRQYQLEKLAELYRVPVTRIGGRRRRVAA